MTGPQCDIPGCAETDVAAMHAMDGNTVLRERWRCSDHIPGYDGPELEDAPARPATGLLPLLSPEQRVIALAYDGPIDQGDAAAPKRKTAAMPQLDLFGPAAPAHDPGGKQFPLGPGVIGQAEFGGPLDCYRYVLLREWGKGATALFVMMNPSSADPLFDDATIAGLTRKVRFHWKPLDGRPWGSFLVANTFAYRCKDQSRLLEVGDPIGPMNDSRILTLATRADIIVMAYGKPKVKALQARGGQVADMLTRAGHDLYAFKASADGTPHHPLYIADNTIPFLWRKAA
jgi:hypothetical protein